MIGGIKLGGWWLAGNNKFKSTKIASYKIRRFSIKYSKIIDKTNDQQLVPRKLIRFLIEPLWKKRFNFLLKCFSNLENIQKTTAEYYFCISLINFEIAKWKAIIGGNKNIYCEEAKKNILKSIELKPHILQYYAHLAEILALTDNYTESFSIIKRKFLPLYRKLTLNARNEVILNYFPILSQTASFIDSRRYNLLAQVTYFKENDTSKAINYLSKARKHDDWNCLSNWLLGIIYFDNEKYDDSFKSFDICTKVEPYWADPYYRQGLILCTKFQFQQAFELLKKASFYSRHYENLEEAKSRIKSLYYHSRGMWFWQSGNYNAACHNFKKLSYCVKNTKLRQYKECLILSHLVRIDRLIFSFYLKENLLALKKAIIKTGTIFMKFFSPNSSYYIESKQFRIFIDLKYHFICSLLSALDHSFRCDYLKHMKNAYKALGCNNILQNFPDERLIFYNLNRYKEMTLYIQFNKIVQAINSLENFTIRINDALSKHKELGKIPYEEQIDLIKILYPFSSTIDGEYTRNYTTKSLIRSIFKDQVYSLKKYFNVELSKQNKLLLNNLKINIKKELDKQSIQKSIPGQRQTLEGEIKILAEGQKEIPEIYFGPERIRFSTTNETSLISNQPMQLLEYFILKKEIHYIYGFIIFKEWRQHTIKDPRRAFGRIVSKLIGPKKGKFAEYNLPLSIQPSINEPDVCELIGACTSNLDDLKVIFVSDFKIDDFDKKAQDLSQKEQIHLKNFLMQKLNNYDNGIQAISAQRNVIENWDDSAAIAFEEIKSEKEKFNSILKGCFNIVFSEPSELDRLKAFNESMSFINFVKTFDINSLGEDQLKKEISEDSIYLYIWNEILKKLFEDIEIKSETEAKALIKKIIGIIRETELDWPRFETKQGLINFLSSKIKRQFKQNRNSKNKDEINYKRSLYDFKRAAEQLELAKPGLALTYEKIAEKLINDFDWTAKRFWNFIALKKFIEEMKPHDDERDNIEGEDDGRDENY